MMTQANPLTNVVTLSHTKILNPSALSAYGGITQDAPVLLVLAAGKGTRFGRDPKCIQPIGGRPLARHSIDAFRRICPSPAVCIVGYQYEAVSAALGQDNIYIHSENPAGGTGLAAFEAFSLQPLLAENPLLIITMGDRIVPPAIYHQLWNRHSAGAQEADLTLLTAHYAPPKNHGKGRILRGDVGQLLGILEQRDIEAETDAIKRDELLRLTEGNCPLYIIRARKLYDLLQPVTNANAQAQYYLTDIIDTIHQAGGEIRTITTSPTDAAYPLLCADLTRPADLPHLTQIATAAHDLLFPDAPEIDRAAQSLLADRRPGQVASIARQLSTLTRMALAGELDFDRTQPIAIALSGGRLRIAFMHPDMARFYGPAWQMPIGAGDESGDEQIVMLLQETTDGQLHFYTTNPSYREALDQIPADDACMYPRPDVEDRYAYETFGTQLSESVLMGLGYFSDGELAARQAAGAPLPPPAQWVSNQMRRPFPQLANAIASLRTQHGGPLGIKVQRALGRTHFQGLRIATTGDIPQGGFASSSALTVAVLNGLNALYGLEMDADTLVKLACQAEYGTGVRAGSLDQATAQKGNAGVGTLLSSNPEENDRILGIFPIPTARFKILFPYSVARDEDAWRWSWGFYGASSGVEGPLTTGEMRLMSGKAAEIAGILTNLPLNQSFFQRIEGDLLSDGLLSQDSCSWICAILRQLPLLVTRKRLCEQVFAQREWLVEQLRMHHDLSLHEASQQADARMTALFSGWRDPHLHRATPGGLLIEEIGVPLRAMVAYLFGEVAKNFALIHHPDQWIHYVTLSQRGDRTYDIDPVRLPTPSEMERPLAWEQGLKGPALLDCWLERCGAIPFDYNHELDDNALSVENPPDFHRLAGTNFFRGLALIDLAEAMLKRAFGTDAVAVRVNGAGQGGYFQVHIDTEIVKAEAVKQFLARAFYRRFGLSPEPKFVEVHTGGGAVGLTLSRWSLLPHLIQKLML